MTREELDNQLKAFDPEAVQDTDKQTTEGKPAEPVKQVVEGVAVNDGLVNELKAQLAERDTKLAEMQSRLDKQSGEFGGTLDKLRNQIREVSDTNEQLKASYMALKEKETAKPVAPAKVVTDDMRNAFPEATEALEQTISALRTELDAIKKSSMEGQASAKRAEQGSVQLAQERFSDALYSAIPDFDAVNVSPAWKEFVTKQDRYGRSLVDNLNDAWGRFNPKPIIEAVKEFKSLSGEDTKAKENEAKAKAEAEKQAKLKAEGTPSSAAGSKEAKPSGDEEVKARQARIAQYKSKISRDPGLISGKEMAQHKKDAEDELKYKLSRMQAA